MPGLPKLSKRELEIMKIIWKLEKASIREVHDKFTETVDLAYPTTKTTMDRMVEKGYLQRTNFHGVFLYESVLSKPSSIARLVQNFMENVLEIDKSAVANLFANSNLLNNEEIKELEELINQPEKDK
jgi:BlaI family transcriptional regulator, penicillinase repressor